MSDINTYADETAIAGLSPINGDLVLNKADSSLYLCTNADATGIARWKKFANDGAVNPPYSTHFESAKYLKLSTPITLSGAFTVSAWFRLDTGATDSLNRMLIGRVTGAANYLTYANLNGSLTTRGGNTSGITFNADSSTWYHLAHIRNTSNVEKVYIDGVERSSFSKNTSYTFDWIGGSNDYLNNTWEGNIDEVGLWLSDQTTNLSSLYTGQTPPDYTALSPDYLWRMGDEDSATDGGPVATITESMGTGNHAVQTVANNQPTFSSDAPA